MPQSQTPAPLDPDAFARQLGGQVEGQTGGQAVGQTAMDPDAFARQLGGNVEDLTAEQPAKLPAKLPTNERSVVTRGRAATPTTPFVDKVIGAMTPGVKVIEGARAVARSMDPRTSSGRRNLAANAAGLGMAALTEGASTLPWITRVFATPVAAAFGGATAEAGEQIAGTKPVTSGTDVALAGAEQGAYEIAGKAFMWVPRQVIQRVKASPIARAAAAGIESKLSTARTIATEEMDKVRDLGRRLITKASDEGTTLVRTARRAVGADVARTKAMAAADVAQAEANQVASIKAASDIYDDLAKDAPSVLDAGKNVRKVVQPTDTPQYPKGAAQRALDAAGAKVGQAAQSGPAIAIKPLQDALDDMAAKARPASIFPPPAPKEGSPAGFIASLRKQMVPEQQVAASAGGPGSTTHVGLSKIEKAIRDQIGVVDERHPLPGILGRVAAMEPGQQISFAEAHQLKKLLDEAVNFDRTAKGHVEQLTKGLRSQLREMLSVHEPYNQATRAFQEVVPLYRKGVGKQLIKAAQEDPDKVVRLLSSKDPARAQAIKDLLVTQAEKGGDAEAGQRAWQSIQSAWVYNHIIKGGPEKLSQRLATELTEHPDFAKVVLNDPTAHRILSNIDRIGQAYHTAVDQTAARLEATKLGGKQAVDDARAMGRERITAAKDAAAVRLRGAKEAVADTTRATARAGRARVQGVQEEAGRFRRSSLSRYTNPSANELAEADVVRATAFGARTIAGALSLVRLLTGPKSADLLEWAAYSDQNTQRLVAALQSRLPDSGVAALLREAAAYVRDDDNSRRPGGAGRVPQAPPSAQR